MSKQIFDILIAGRSLCRFGPDFTDLPTLKMWGRFLQEVSVSELQEAMVALAGDKDFPTPNEIKEFARQKRGSADRSPIEAFEHLWNQIRLVGSYSEPELPNEIGLAVQKLGGWRRICNSWTDENRNWHQKEFEGAYSEVIDRKSRGLALETSKYAPEALKGESPLSLPSNVQNVLREANKAAKPKKPKSLLQRFREEVRQNKTLEK